MGKTGAVTGLSSPVNTIDNENLSEDYRHVGTTLCRDAEGLSVIARFIPDDNSVPSNLTVRSDFLPKVQAESKATKLLTVADVAKETGWSPKTVRKFIRLGIIEALLGGPPYKLTREALDRYLRGELPPKRPYSTGLHAGSKAVAIHKSAPRPRTMDAECSGKPEEAEIKYAVEVMKFWPD